MRFIILLFVFILLIYEIYTSIQRLFIYYLKLPIVIL